MAVGGPYPTAAQHDAYKELVEDRGIEPVLKTIAVWTDLDGNVCEAYGEMVLMWEHGGAAIIRADGDYTELERL